MGQVEFPLIDAVTGKINPAVVPDLTVTVPAYARPRAGHYDTASNLYNWKPSNTRRWRCALAKARAGTGYARLNCYGDSITQGATSTPTPIRNNAWATRLRTAFDAVYGAAGTGAVYVPTDSDDTRVVFSGTWSSYTPFAAFGSWAQYSATVGSYVTFTATCDTFTIHALAGAGAGPLGVSIDGGTVTNYVTAQSTTAPKAITVSAGTLGSHTIKIAVVGPGPVWVESIEGSIGSAGVRVTRWGKGNATAGWLVNGQSGDASSTTTGSLPFSFDLFPPDLSIISLGVNEFLTHVSVSTYKTNMQTIITKALTFGDVLLATQVPNQDITGTPAQADYNNALYDLADSNDVAVLDVGDRMVSFTASTSLMNAPTHPNAAGYWDMADATYRAIAGRI